MNKLIFATNNSHKLEEIQHLTKDTYNIVGLKDVHIAEDLPETHETLKENAIEKAMYVYDKYNFNCFADDTGLEIDYLNGRPGVYSARYAGLNCSFDDNINKILQELGETKQRKARFRTVIALVENGQTHTFEGRIEGEILMEKIGIKGFGYDPVFRPKGYDLSFAEMSLNLKNQISHRALALKEFIRFLESRT